MEDLDKIKKELEDAGHSLEVTIEEVLNYPLIYADRIANSGVWENFPQLIDDGTFTETVTIVGNSKIWGEDGVHIKRND